MKKITILFTLFLSVGIYAQNMYDALRYSQNSYTGTARTMSMGNAFTALGGDVGSININPAGSAVNNFSQIVISPNISIASSTAQGSTFQGESTPYCFQDLRQNNFSRFSITNAGIVVNFDTNRKRGLKGVSIGFNMNTNNDFTDNLYASGTNIETSFAAAMAAGAYNISNSVFDDKNSYDKGGASWQQLLGWDTRLFDPLGDTDNEYIGSTENLYDDGSIGVGGMLDQSYSRRITGEKNDFAFNVGFNISDQLFFGANLGYTSLSYRYDDIMKEVAQDPSMFETGFKGLKFQNRYDAQGVGIYGKFGILYASNFGLRLGAAIQTPTATFITEHWMNAAESSFLDSQYSSSGKTPEGSYSYKLISPFSFNLGAAFSVGKFAVISTDYEMADYSGMKLKAKNRYDDDIFDDANNQIQGNYDDLCFMGASHSFRAGIEIKPIPTLALRGGYNLTTSPERYYDETNNIKKVGNSNINSFSFGIGYSSKSSFFADLAAKCTKYADEYIMPYSDYIFNDNGTVAVYSPEILHQKSLWNVALTIGFRF